MNKIVQIILLLLLLVLVLFIGYWFYNNMTWVKEERNIGFQGLAGTNQLLAADFFLRKMGVNTHQMNGLSDFRDLPSTQHTILIATQRETINQELNQHLLAWVKSGGHLIIEAQYLPDYKKTTNNIMLPLKDELLKEWSLISVDSEAKNDSMPVALFLDYPKESEAIEVNFPYDKTLMFAHSDNTHYSDQEPIWLINDHTAQYLMQLTLGQGLLTILTSTHIFKNNAIKNYDHAQFLHYLVQLPEHNAGVWLIRVNNMPPLWQWLWQNAWTVMLSLSCLLLLWLWRVPFRFGPVLNDTQLERRSLLEHLQASAYYRWHNNESGYLLKQVQHRLWVQIRQLHPSIPCDDRLQAYQMLADITGIKQSLIAKALLKESELSHSDLNESDFTKKIKLLESIRASL